MASQATATQTANPDKFSLDIRNWDQKIFVEYKDGTIHEFSKDLNPVLLHFVKPIKLFGELKESENSLGVASWHCEATPKIEETYAMQSYSASPSPQLQEHLEKIVGRLISSLTNDEPPANWKFGLQTTYDHINYDLKISLWRQR